MSTQGARLPALLLALLLAVSMAGDGAAQEASQEVGGGLADAWTRLNGQVSLRAGIFTHDRDLNQEELVPVGGIWARLAPSLSDGVDAFAEGWVQADRVGKTDGELREGWLRLGGGPVELRLGRQIVIWGRTDRLNPTDVLGSRDYTLLVSSDDDQRRGVTTARLSWFTGPWTVEAMWLPEFRPNKFPLDQSRAGVALLPDERPVDRGQVAVKVDRTGGAIDWSVSYFDGIDRTRDIVLDGVRRGGPSGVEALVRQRFPDIRTIGADLAGVSGQFGYRVEAAYTLVRGTDTPFRKNDHLWLVAGADTTLESGWNINLQYSFRYIADHTDPGDLTDPIQRAVALQSAAVTQQLDRVQNGGSLRLARRWDNDRLELEVVAIGFVESADVAVRPRVSYAFTDNLRGSLGADIFAGPAISYFGRVQDLSGAYATLTYGF